MAGAIVRPPRMVAVAAALTAADAVGPAADAVGPAADAVGPAADAVRSVIALRILTEVGVASVTALRVQTGVTAGAFATALRVQTAVAAVVTVTGRLVQTVVAAVVTAKGRLVQMGARAVHATSDRARTAPVTQTGRGVHGTSSFRSGGLRADKIVRSVGEGHPGSVALGETSIGIAAAPATIAHPSEATDQGVVTSARPGAIAHPSEATALVSARTEGGPEATIAHLSEGIEPDRAATTARAAHPVTSVLAAVRRRTDRAVHSVTSVRAVASMATTARNGAQLVRIVATGVPREGMVTVGHLMRRAPPIVPSGALAAPSTTQLSAGRSARSKRSMIPTTRAFGCRRCSAKQASRAAEPVSN